MDEIYVKIKGQWQYMGVPLINKLLHKGQVLISDAC